MKEIRNPAALQKEMLKLRAAGKTIGFVPTMGALHDGHAALIQAARKECDRVVVSIFVNPTQFGPKEDLNRYPRPVRQDRRLLEKEKVDYLFRPRVTGMYPGYPEGAGLFVDFNPSPDFQALTGELCGRFRPGHFRGVATVVAKLFSRVLPHRTYFGAKDYQQSRVIEVLIEELGFPIRFRRIPTVREEDGLALSSRNRYLSAKERRRALALPETLFWMRQELRHRRSDLASVLREGRLRLTRAGLRVQYLEIVHPKTLQRLPRARKHSLAAAAVYAGKTRLIDNVIISL